MAPEKGRNPGRLPKQGRFRGLREITLPLEKAMSTFDPNRVAMRLTMDRLGSYLLSTGRAGSKYSDS